MAIVASIFAVAALAAFVKSEVPFAVACAVLSGLSWDSYRRDRRGRKRSHGSVQPWATSGLAADHL